MLTDIWRGFRVMPLWVQIWVALILVPVNMAPLLFLGQPGAMLVAIFAIGGMTPNLFILLRQRGFPKSMAISHVILWPILIAGVIWLLSSDAVLSNAWRNFLIVLLAVDLISLGFDVPDTRAWWIARNEQAPK